MPNWCAGTLRIRGPKKNVIKFLNECFEVYDVRLRDDQGQLTPVCSMMERVKAEDVNVGPWIPVHLNDNGEYIYVTGTKRAFIEWDPAIGMYQNEDETYEYTDWLWECPCPFVGG